MIFRVSVKEMFLAGSVESRTALFKTKKKILVHCLAELKPPHNWFIGILNLEIIGACLPLYAY